MQMVLILATGYGIAVSPPAAKGIDWIASKIRTPAMVYVIVTAVGCLFSFVSWGWIVLTAILGRELAVRVKKVDYRLLTACVYTALLPWHGGLSGSVPLLIDTPNNFLIKRGSRRNKATSQGFYGLHFSFMHLVCDRLFHLRNLVADVKSDSQTRWHFHGISESVTFQQQTICGSVDNSAFIITFKLIIPP